MTDIKTTKLELITPRLRLIPLEPELFRLFITDMSAVEGPLALEPARVEIPPEIKAELDAGDGAAYRHMLEQMERDPEQFAWYTSWLIVSRETHQVIGSTGFAGPPNDRGEVYTGYWLDPRYHNRGYMSEALAVLAAWVFSHPEARVVQAETPKDNIGSQRVLEKNGFVLREEREEGFLWEIVSPHAGDGDL